MSEYWKSTPKFWCKYCSTYVKDTPLEKRNHEESPRHQGNLKRSLRDLHKANDKAERDKQYAKAEAARLNGTSSGAGPLDSGDGKFKTTVNFTKTASKSASVDDRKWQMAQLAELGVAVPEDFRRDNAMVGDWQTTSQKVIWDGNAGTKAEDEVDVKPGLNIGVRKRKIEEKEEDDEEPVKLEEGRRRPRFGRDLKALPGNNDDDLDALLGSTTSFTKKVKTTVEVKKEDIGDKEDESPASHSTEPALKREDSDDVKDVKESEAIEDLPNESPPMFKKRKKPMSKK